jgi:hypothetical protein
MSIPHFRDAGFSITPACRNNASRLRLHAGAGLPASNPGFPAASGLVLVELIG